MPISGLVITTQPEQRDEVLAALRDIPEVTLGTPRGCKLPVVTEVPTLSAARKLTEALMRMPGIDFVDVVSVDFQDEEL